MAAPETAAMPPNLDITDGYTIRLTAVDPTTGAVVSGVTVKNLVMSVIPAGGSSGTQLGYGAFMFVPGPGA